MTQVALTIAGSDSGGGAGIQADLRTFAFHGVHGTSAITCLTAQNTVGVDRVEAVAPAMVVAQIETVAADMAIAATKTGMLLNGEIMEAVAGALERLELGALVVDPVMVSRTGAKLIDDRAIATLQERLLPLAALTTPNRYEAQILSGGEINSLDDMKRAAEAIYQLGSGAVLVKGGAMARELRGVDVWFAGEEFEVLETVAVETHNNHGTGCTLAAAIAANLALGRDRLSAVRQGKDYVSEALRYALDIGRGSGPVGHFFPLLERGQKASRED